MLHEQRRGMLNEAAYELGMQKHKAASAVQYLEEQLRLQNHDKKLHAKLSDDF